MSPEIFYIVARYLPSDDLISAIKSCKLLCIAFIHSQNPLLAILGDTRTLHVVRTVKGLVPLYVISKFPVSADLFQLAIRFGQDGRDLCMQLLTPLKCLPLSDLLSIIIEANSPDPNEAINIIILKAMEDRMFDTDMPLEEFEEAFSKYKPPRNELDESSSVIATFFMWKFVQHIGMPLDEYQEVHFEYAPPEYEFDESGPFIAKFSMLILLHQWRLRAHTSNG